MEKFLEMSKKRKQNWKTDSTLTELKYVVGYVLEAENIQENVYNRDGPVGKSLRSWAWKLFHRKHQTILRNST